MTDIETADEGREFDWLEDPGDVVVRAPSAVAVYPGPAGVVIRRPGDHWNGDGDDVTWFTTEHAPAVAAAILEAAGLDATALAPAPTRVGSKPKDSTAAGRQRRYRERQKRESPPDIFDRADRDDRDVTDRDTATRDGKAA